MSFPADYAAAHLAGKEVHFEVSLHEVAEPRLPEVNADFARAMGVADGDVAKLREEIKANLEREVKRRVQTQVKEQVMKLLSERTELQVPKSLVAMEAERLLQQAQKGCGARQGLRSCRFRPICSMNRPARRVRLGIILAEVVKAQGLSTKPEQVRALVRRAGRRVTRSRNRW